MNVRVSRLASCSGDITRVMQLLGLSRGDVRPDVRRDDPRGVSDVTLYQLSDTLSAGMRREVAWMLRRGRMHVVRNSTTSQVATELAP